MILYIVTQTCLRFVIQSGLAVLGPSSTCLHPLSLGVLHIFTTSSILLYPFWLLGFSICLAFDSCRHSPLWQPLSQLPWVLLPSCWLLLKKQWIYFQCFLPPFRWARDVPTWPWSTTCWSQFRGSLSTGCCWQVGSQTLPASWPWLPLLSMPFLSMLLPTLHDPLPDRWVKSLGLSCFQFCEHHVQGVTSAHSCRVCHHMYTLTSGIHAGCALCSDALSP